MALMAPASNGATTRTFIAARPGFTAVAAPVSAPVATGTIQRTNPVFLPTTTLKPPTTALPQPAFPAPSGQPGPILPGVPILPRPIAPSVPPASPISGSPVVNSIFQPTHTTSTILAGAQSGFGYQEPQPSFNLGSSGAVAAPVGTGAVSFSSPQFAVNLDSTTILVLIVIAAIVLLLL
jgi:hypothetical protein